MDKIGIRLDRCFIALGFTYCMLYDDTPYWMYGVVIIFICVNMLATIVMDDDEGKE